MAKESTKHYLERVYEKSFDEDIFSNAAQVAFYFLLALFPLLIFLISIFGIVLGQNNEIRQELFGYLGRVMPSSAYDLVNKTMDEVIKESSGSKITFGLLATLYSASVGIDSVRIALNGLYTLPEERSWWKRKLMSLAMTIGLGLIVFLALGVVFYGNQLVSFLIGQTGLDISSPLILQIPAIVIVLLLLFATLYAVYYFVPNHKDYGKKWITPGAVIALALWLLVSKGFSLYLQYFDTYARTYGSLGAMIVLMLWLYLTALVILAGGVFNAVLDEFARGQYDKLDPCEKEMLKHPHEHDSNDDDKGESEKDNNNGNAEIIISDSANSRKAAAANEPELEPKKTTLKVIVGAVIAGVIEIFSFKNKR